MRKTLLYHLLLSGIFCTNAIAQNTTPYLYPNVQKINNSGKELPIDGIKLGNTKWQTFVGRTAVGNMLNATDVQNVWTLNIGIKNDFVAEKFAKKIAKAEGAYFLKIHKKSITIAAKDSIGAFYGLQTLQQLIKNQQISQVEITDFPTVKYRGVVEGFYGTPWSQTDRISQLKFYGTIKANTYIYGPKDDPYHSSPNWRTPYPENQASQIKELVKVAKENYVDFVWAIHPGKDIKWTYDDQYNVIRKFESMYTLGVRSFAVFFDDISGEGTDAHKQAALLNLINDKFVKVKKDVKPLMICPTEYNKSWANPKPNGYLNILGKELDPSVQIMWTGDRVVADITKSSLQWVQERIKRPALVWWNFPVSDYVRAHLLLGPSYGLEKDINDTQMAGILSNPMEHAEASKSAIFGLCDYAWNTSKYNPDTAWKYSIETIVPKAADAYQIFAENNADPGKNGHKYRRDESTVIAPYILSLSKSISTHNANEQDLKFVEAYFEKISKAASIIENTNDNVALTTEIKPWLDDFTLLGQKGLAEIKNYQNAESEQPALYWSRIVNTIQKTNKKPTSKKENKNTIIPITGTLVLRPFVDSLQVWNNQKFVEEISGIKNTINTNNHIGSISTDISALQNIKLTKGKTDDEINIQAPLEVFEIQPNQNLIIKLGQLVKHAEIKTTLESEDLNWALIEVSKDGKKWFSPGRFDQDQNISCTIDGTYFQYIRLENIDTQAIKTKMKQFSIRFLNENTAENTTSLHDFDVYSAYQLKAQQILSEANPISEAHQLIILSNSDQTLLYIQLQKLSGEWIKIEKPLQGTYINIPLNDTYKAVQITSNKDIDIHEIIWK